MPIQDEEPEPGRSLADGDVTYRMPANPTLCNNTQQPASTVTPDFLRRILYINGPLCYNTARHKYISDVIYGGTCNAAHIARRELCVVCIHIAFCDLYFLVISTAHSFPGLALFRPCILPMSRHPDNAATHNDRTRRNIKNRIRPCLPIRAWPFSFFILALPLSV